MAGKLQGLQKDGVLQFRGIPYARAERFGPSRPTDGWVGIRDATAFGPMAHQNPSPLEGMLGAQGQGGDEDCLVVNVYTPAADDGARPVMAWIHGGAFVAGSGHVPWYNGSNLARLYDVVVVTCDGARHASERLGERMDDGVDHLTIREGDADPAGHAH